MRLRIKKTIILAMIGLMLSQADVNYISATDDIVGERVYGNITSKIEKNSNGDYVTTLSGEGDIKRNVYVIGKVIVSEGITGIGNNVFIEDQSITEVILPNSLITIGDNSFEECSNITEITIPSSVQSVGKDPFLGCQRLKKIVNNSKVEISAPRFVRYGHRRGYDYYVDGKPATKVAPGKTMIGKPHKYKLNLKLNGGKIVGKKMKTYDIVKNTILPRAKKKGYDFVGWTDENDSANGILKLWRADLIVGGKQTRYAQFCKVKMTGKKKSIQIKVTNSHFPYLCVYYSTKKDRSDEKMVKVVNDASEKLHYYREGSYKAVKIKGKRKYYEKDRKKTYISMTLPIFKSKTKYYIRLKSIIPYGEEMEKEYGYSDFFGRRTVRVK